MRKIKHTKIGLYGNCMYMHPIISRILHEEFFKIYDLSIDDSNPNNTQLLAITILWVKQQGTEVLVDGQVGRVSSKSFQTISHSSLVDMRQGKGNHPVSTCIFNEGKRCCTCREERGKNKSRVTLKWAVGFIQIEMQPGVLPPPHVFPFKILQYTPRIQHCCGFICFFYHTQMVFKFSIQPTIREMYTFKTYHLTFDFHCLPDICCNQRCMFKM